MGALLDGLGPDPIARMPWSQAARAKADYEAWRRRGVFVCAARYDLAAEAVLPRFGYGEALVVIAAASALRRAGLLETAAQYVKVAVARQGDLCPEETIGSLREDSAWGLTAAERTAIAALGFVIFALGPAREAAARGHAARLRRHDLLCDVCSTGRGAP